MAISFRCPNGHKLTCPEQRAGQRGRCPKCGATFQVPSPPEQAETEGQLVGAAVAQESAADDASAGSDDQEPTVNQDAGGSNPDIASAEPHETTTPETIVFLCPNGHKLNAPARMQGKPGKCPHCAERFLIPSLDDEDAGESTAFFDMLGDQGASQAAEEPEPPEPAPAAATDSGFNFAGFAPEDEFTVGLLESGPQAMANLFQRLWSQRGETGIVELYLKGGEILSPHWYAPQLSQHAYGMFAFQEQDGSHTLTAVHWDAIERIALRGLAELPNGVFEV